MENDEFPPARHIARDLRIAYQFPAAGRLELTVPVVSQILDLPGAGEGHADVGHGWPQGSTVRPDVVATLLDESLGFASVIATLPDWVSTAALQIDFLGEAVPGDGVAVEVDVSIVKSGRRLVFVEGLVRCGATLIAVASGQFARVPRSDRNVEMAVPEPDPDEVFDMALPESALSAPFPEAVGMTTTHAGSGEVELVFGPYVRNSAGILHGGVVASLALRSAEVASGGTPAHLDLQFLSPGRVGPFRTRAEPVDGGRLWRVETRDDGDDGRVMTRATVATRTEEHHG